jgi:Na+/H+-dicarboxylate symporter
MRSSGEDTNENGRVTKMQNPLQKRPSRWTKGFRLLATPRDAGGPGPHKPPSGPKQNESRGGRYSNWITFGSLGALGAGLAVGLLAHGSGSPRVEASVLFLMPLATIWLGLLQLIVFPLIVSFLLVSIVSSDDAERPGKMGVLTLLCFVSILCLGAAFSLAAASILVGGFRIEPSALASLPAGVASPRATTSGALAAWGWVRDLASSSLKSSVTEGCILPILAATVAVAIAMRQLPATSRARFVKFFKKVSDATLAAVRWLFYALPVVVFILMSAVYSRTGSLIVRGIGYYVLTVSGTLLAFAVLQYFIVWFAAGISIPRFARSLWAAQGAAVTTRSSLASLPPLLDGALYRAGVPAAVAAFVLPLSVSTFKASQSLYPLFKLIFLAHLFGISLRPASLLAFVAGVFVLSFAAPGVPSGGSVHTIPLLLALGIPIQGIILFNSVEAIPDIFETLLNVTADMAVAVIVNRLLGTAPGTANV